MASSGQGNLGEVAELVKQAVGLSSGSGLGAQAQSAGIAGLANMLGLGDSKPKNSNGRSTKRTTRSSTRRNAAAGAKGGDDLESILKSATGAHPDDEWSDVIQRYVKNTVAKASGLEWLFGDKDEKKKATR